MVLVRNVKFVLRAVRTMVGCRPLVEVHLVDTFTVQLDSEPGSVASDYHVVPLSRWLHGIFRRFDQIVERTRVVKKSSRGVIDGDFNTVEADILARPGSQWECPDEDTAIAALANPEIEREDKVGPNLLVNHHVTATAVRVQATILNRRLAGMTTAGLPPVQALTIE